MKTVQTWLAVLALLMLSLTVTHSRAEHAGTTLPTLGGPVKQPDLCRKCWVNTHHHNLYLGTNALAVFSPKASFSRPLLPKRLLATEVRPEERDHFLDAPLGDLGIRDIAVLTALALAGYSLEEAVGSAMIPPVCSAFE